MRYRAESIASMDHCPTKSVVEILHRRVRDMDSEREYYHTLLSNAQVDIARQKQDAADIVNKCNQRIAKISSEMEKQLQQMEDRHQAEIGNYIAQIEALKQRRVEKESGSDKSTEKLMKEVVEARSRIAILEAKCTSHLQECKRKTVQLSELSVELSKKQVIIDSQNAKIRELENEVEMLKDRRDMTTTGADTATFVRADELGRRIREILQRSAMEPIKEPAIEPAQEVASDTHERSAVYTHCPISSSLQECHRLPPSPYVSRGKRYHKAHTSVNASNTPATPSRIPLSRIPFPRFAPDNDKGNGENDITPPRTNTHESPVHTPSPRRPLDNIFRQNQMHTGTRRSSSLGRETLSFLAKTKPTVDELQAYVEKQRNSEKADIADYLSLCARGTSRSLDDPKLFRRLCRMVDEKYPQIDINTTSTRPSTTRPERGQSISSTRKKSVEEVKTKILEKRNEEAVEFHRNYINRINTPKFGPFRIPGRL